MQSFGEYEYLVLKQRLKIADAVLHTPQQKVDSILLSVLY